MATGGEGAEPPSGGRAHAMPDRWTYALAGAVLLGASVAWPGPRLVALGLSLAALALRRPLLLCCAAALLASFAAAAATAAVNNGIDPGPMEGRIVLVTDPASGTAPRHASWPTLHRGGWRPGPGDVRAPGSRVSVPVRPSTCGVVSQRSPARRNGCGSEAFSGA